MSFQGTHVLVVGGAGYIGSTMVAYLLDQGCRVTVLDNLSTGHRELVLTESFVEGNCGSRETLDSIFSGAKIDCVMHFAAKSIVSESVQNPDLYYENNVLQTTVLLNAMLDHGVRRLVFSSTCAVFGEGQMPRISEEHPRRPINPYGQTKLEAELLMEKLARARGLQTVALRYFNACGADPGGRVGEWHEPETHLIPRLLRAAEGRMPAQVFGTDYSTPDGSCVRDYVHVWDLARAHFLAMNLLLKDGQNNHGSFHAFNLGSEKGTSVLELCAAVSRLVGYAIPVEALPRRVGDPAVLVADSSLARRVLGWSPEATLETILETALAWEKRGAGRGLQPS